MTLDPILLGLLAGTVAAIIVAAAVPRFRTAALAALGALSMGVVVRLLDRFGTREPAGRREPAPARPDGAEEAEAAAEEAEAVAEAQEAATVTEEDRQAPPDVDTLVARANARLRRRR